MAYQDKRATIASFFLACAAAIMVFAAAAARAETPAEAGAVLAGQRCATCHRTGPAPGRGAGEATPLFAIAARPATTAASLHEFLSRPHGRIPEGTFSAAQVDELVAYVLSLKP